MKRNQKAKDKAYSLAANSKLTGVDFAKATKWASQIYAPLKLHEKHLCKRSVFQNLSKLLVEVYHSDEINALGTKKLSAGNVDKLTKWRLSPYSAWQDRLGIKIGLTTAPTTGKASVSVAQFELPAHRFVERARQMAMRFYVYQLNEDNEQLTLEATDNLLADFDVAYQEVTADFEFPPLSNGVLLLVGVAQLYLATPNQQEIFASFDRLYYQANLMQALAIRNGKPVLYRKKETTAPEEVSIAKVAWQRKSL